MKKRIIAILVMVFILAVSVFLSELYRRPNTDVFVNTLLSLPEYRDARELKNIPETYQKAKEYGASKIIVYSVPNGVSTEFAVIKMMEEDASGEAVVEVLKERISELKKAFSYSEEETRRLSDARIINSGKYVFLAVYDSDQTAEKLIHSVLDR